jgi:hypothetical protein
MTVKKTEEEIFASIMHSDVARLEDGTDNTDFQARTVRACAVHTREDVALLVYHVAKVRDVLGEIKKLLSCIAICAVVAILLHWWHA